MGDMPGGEAEALLGARVRVVDPPAVEVELDAAQRGHAVDHQQRVAAAHRRAQLGERVLGCRWTSRRGRRRAARASGCWSSASSRRSFGTCSPQSAETSWTRGAAAPSDLGDPARRSTRCWPTITVSPGSTRFARPASIPDVPGGLQRQHEPGLGAVDPAQQVHQLEQDLVQLGVEVPEHRLAASPRARLGRRWSGRGRRAASSDGERGAGAALMGETFAQALLTSSS